jgi:hypothetical protein
MKLSTREQQIARIFSPVAGAAAIGLILAGCNPAAPAGDGGDMMSSSSAMISSSASDAVMSSSSTEAMMSSVSSSVSAPPMSSSAAASIYRDGTYSANGVYRSPAGGESIRISLTLKDDVVTAATFSGDATNPKSIAMQTAFGAGFEAQVVGKSIDEVNVGVVNGSSLTGGGFNEAVAKIKAEAKA